MQRCSVTPTLQISRPQCRRRRCLDSFGQKPVRRFNHPQQLAMPRLYHDLTFSLVWWMKLNLRRYGAEVRPKAAGVSWRPLRLGRQRSSQSATLACSGYPDIVEANELLSFLTPVNKAQVVVKRVFCVRCRPCGDQKPVLLISIPPQQGFLARSTGFPCAYNKDMIEFESFAAVQGHQLNTRCSRLNGRVFCF